MLRAYREFRPVAHLWAAMLHGQQNDRADIHPGSIGTLPKFLAYADAFLERGCALPRPEKREALRYSVQRHGGSSFRTPCANLRIQSPFLSIRHKGTVSTSADELRL